MKPKGPRSQRVYIYILWPQSSYIGTSLTPKYILFGHMDPQGKIQDEDLVRVVGKDADDVG